MLAHLKLGKMEKAFTCEAIVCRVSLLFMPVPYSSQTRLLLALACASAAAAGLIFCRPWAALPGSLLIASGLAAYLFRWAGPDARANGFDDSAWPWAMLLWPLALPAYLVLSRGSKGLLLAAAALTTLFMLPFSFLGAVVYQDYRAGIYLEKGQEYFWDEHDPQGKEKALGAYRRALDIDPASWRAYYMIFSLASELDRPELAQEYYGRLESLLDGWWRRTSGDGALIGWYITAFSYHDFARLRELTAAQDALDDADVRRFAVRARAALRVHKYILELMKDWDRLYASLEEAEKRKYAQDLRDALEYFSRLSLEGWKAESADRLAEKIEKDEAWRSALEEYGKGVRERALGHTADSTGHFFRASELRPEFAEPDLLRASILLDEKRYAQAYSAAVRAAERFRRSGTTLFQEKRESQLATAYALEGFSLFYRKETGRAKNALARSLAEDGENPSALLLKEKLALVR